MKKSIICIILIFLYFYGILIMGCSTENPLRSPNGTVLILKTYALALEDSSRLLSISNNKIKLNSLNDSLIAQTDTIWYKDPLDTLKNLFGRIDQMIINSRNRDIKELYSFNDKGIYLIGYVTPETAKPYTRFNPPILIYPDSNTVNETSDSKMITLDSKGIQVGEGVITKTDLIRKMSGLIEINGKEEKCYLYELTIKQDAVIQYGEQGLIVPEAIVLSSNLLIGIKSNLIAEWGIRVKQMREAKTNKQNQKKNEMETYLELNIYNQINVGDKMK